MSDGEPLSLSYESGLPGALEPGERVAWEVRPDSSRIRESWTLRGLLVAIVTFMVCTATASLTRDFALTFIAAVASIVFVGGAMVLAGSGDARKRREIDSVVYQITNRRLMRVREEPVRLASELEVDELQHFRVATRRSGDAQLDVCGGFSLPHLREPHDFVARVLDVVHQSGRRARLRRSPSSAKNEVRMPEAVATPALPSHIALATGETVLWVGRSRTAQRHDSAWLYGRLQLLGFTALAAYWLLASIGMLPSPFGGVPAWVGVIAALFLIGFLKALLITPFQESARRRRTTYAITTVRCIVHRAGRTAVTESFLLDMCGTATLGEQPDGSGYVQFGFNGPLFQRIENVSAVHQIALDAIRNAGTPIKPPCEADEDLM